MKKKKLIQIPITGCHKCKNPIWETIRPSRADYYCIKCNSPVNQVLRRTK